MNDTTYKEKFVAFLNGLEMSNVDDLVEQDIKFISYLAQQMARQIKRRRSLVVLPVPAN